MSDELDKLAGSEFIERNRQINQRAGYKGQMGAFNVVQRDNLLGSKHRRTKAQIQRKAKITAIKRKMQKQSRKKNRKK